MARLLKADGTVEELTTPLTLPQMQTLVGGYIEVVWIGANESRDRRHILIVNEDGRREGLPLNYAATLLYRGTPPRHDDVIVGDAIEALALNSGEDDERIV